jgi:hypothetical protein
MVIFRYVKHLFSLWTTIIFTIVDLVAYIIGASSQHFSMHAWVYWFIAGIGFLIANIQLYIQQEKKIIQYEATEADLIIKPLEAGDCYVPYIIGYDLREMPKQICLLSKFEIENIGIEPGSLLCEVDTTKSEIPDVFILDESELTGSFLGKSRVEVYGRDRINIEWELSVISTVSDAKLFAQRVKGIKDYQLLIHYKTKRIGGFSRPRQVVLRGQFDYFKDRLFEQWTRTNHPELCEILRPHKSADVG